jgi:hypothetical protein
MQRKVVLSWQQVQAEQGIVCAKLYDYGSTVWLVGGGSMNRFGQLLLGLSILLFGATATARVPLGSLQQNDGSNAAAEIWGGQDVHLEMNAQGATVEFDCADGKISQPIKVDSTGEFTAQGTYTPGQFGLIRKNHASREVPATYKGTVSGDTMHLQVILENKKIQPPPFTLTKGDSGHVVRCH